MGAKRMSTSVPAVDREVVVHFGDIILTTILPAPESHPRLPKLPEFREDTDLIALLGIFME
jgi:hypothetical protein